MSDALKSGTETVNRDVLENWVSGSLSRSCVFLNFKVASRSWNKLPAL